MAEKINNKTILTGTPLWLNMSVFDDGTLDVKVLVDDVEVENIALNVDDMSIVVDEITKYIKEITT